MPHREGHSIIDEEREDGSVDEPTGTGAPADPGTATGGGTTVVVLPDGTVIELPPLDEGKTDTSDIPDGPGDVFDSSDRYSSDTTTASSTEGSVDASIGTDITSFPTPVDTRLDFFKNEWLLLRTDILNINTTTESEWEQAIDKLTLNFQPRILSMIDFVPLYEGDDNTETAAYELINNKRTVFKKFLDEIIDEFSIDGAETRNILISDYIL
jgi:hypothetical protein